MSAKGSASLGERGELGVEGAGEPREVCRFAKRAE